jgi:hypothetical protein
MIDKSSFPYHTLAIYIKELAVNVGNFRFPEDYTLKGSVIPYS